MDIFAESDSRMLLKRNVFVVCWNFFSGSAFSVRFLSGQEVLESQCPSPPQGLKFCVFIYSSKRSGIMRFFGTLAADDLIG